MNEEQLSGYLFALTNCSYSTMGQIEGLKVTLETLITTLALDAELP